MMAGIKDRSEVASDRAATAGTGGLAKPSEQHSTTSRKVSNNPMRIARAAAMTHWLRLRGPWTPGSRYDTYDLREHHGISTVGQVEQAIQDLVDQGRVTVETDGHGRIRVYLVEAEEVAV